MKGASLRPVRVATDPAPTQLMEDGSGNNVEVQDLSELPEAPSAPSSFSQQTSKSDDSDLNSLPDAGGQLGKVYDGVSHIEPSRAGQVIGTAQKLGQSEAFVDKNLDIAKRAAESPPGDMFQEIEAKYPGTTKFLSDPRNMAVTHDDVPNLAKHEQLVQGITQARGYSDAIKAGWQGSAIGMSARDALPDTALSEDAPWDQKLLSAAAGLAGDAPLMAAGAAAGFGVAGPIGAAFGTFAAPAAYKSAFRQHFAKGDIQGINDLMDRGAQTLNDATKQGLIGVLTQAAGGATAALTKGSSSLVLKTLAPLAAEDVAMTTAGNAAEGKETKASDYLDTALQIGGMHMAGEFASAGVEHYVEAKRTAQAAQFYKALGEAGGASKLLERLPEQYSAMLGNLTDDSPVENVYIPQEAFRTYFQSKGIDPEQAAADLGVSDSFNEASKVTGSDVSIPMKDWVTKVVKTEHYAGLANDVKFDPEGLTINQIDQRNGDIQAQMKEMEAARAKTPETPLEPTNDATQPIADKIQEQLIATGMSPEDAATNAKIHEKFFQTMAERTGQDPLDLFNKYQLSIQRRDAAQAPTADGADLEFSQEEIKTLNQAGLSNDEINNVIDASSRFGKKTEQPKILSDYDMEMARGRFEEIDDLLNDTRTAPRARAELEAEREDLISKAKASQEAKDDVEAQKVRKGVLRAKKFDSLTSDQAITLGAFIARAGDDKSAVKAIKDAQSAENGPYVSANEAKGIGWAPNFMAEPIGTIGPARISESHTLGAWVPGISNGEKPVIKPSRVDAETDPLKWAESKYGATKQLIEKHAVAGKPLVINTSSDLVSHQDYIDKMPKDTTVNMYLSSKDSDVNRALFPGNASRLRQEKAIEGLKEAGIKVNAIEPSVESLIEAAGGLDDAARKLGIAPEEVDARLQKTLGLRLANNRNSFSQNESPTSARARILFGQNKNTTIEFFKGADASSFLHEVGHFYLEVLGDLAHEENAPQQIKDDYATLLKYLGVESRDQIQTEHHETLARTFEAYLREGKAPSEALRETFGRIRDWLINIYKNLKQLNVELTPEVRGVMDRLLASDEEIRQVAKDTGYADTVSSGSPETAGKIGTLQERARQMAMDTLVKEQMKEIKASTQEELKAEREKLTVIAETRVREQVPVFKAEDELKSGGHASPVGLAQKFLDGKLDDQGQADFHAIAEVHGFASGEDLAKSMVEAKISNQFKNEVEGRVQAGMRKHDLMNDKNSMRAEAMKAIHNDRSTELLALEHQILNDLTEKKDIKGKVAKRKRLEASIDARAAKEQAVKILSTKTIKDAGNSRIYVTAERNAAAKAAGSIAKDDFEAAAKFKKQQLFNHALAAEAMKNNEEAGKALDYLDTIIKRGPDLKDMPQGFIRQADQLLSKFGFMDPRPEDLITNAKIARGMLENGQSLPDIANATGLMQAQDGRWVPEDLQSFVERVNKNYRAFEVPDSVLKSGKDYKELTMQELRDVKDTIKTIATIGKTYDRFLEAYRTMGIREAAGLFRKSIEENFGTPYAEHLQPGSTYTTRLTEILGNISEMPAALKRHLDSMLTITDNMDGGKEGPAKDNIYRPLAAAQDRESTRNYKMAQEVDAIYAKHYTPEELAKYKDTRVKIDGRTFTKENILSMALNWGNSINRERLTQGFKFDEAKFERIFDQYLDKRDWDFVQDTWNHINDSYWADLAKLEMDTKGVQPEKVEALPFDNIHGSYAGGYYPIAYDYDKSIQANQNMIEANDMWAQSSTGSAQTARGHAMARVATTKQPIRLSLDVLTRHHENMVHDLEFRRAVIDVNRFLNQTDTKTALLNAVGVKGYNGVMDWLKSAARNVSEPMSPFDQAAQWFRFKATMYMMGFRIATAPKIFLENQINAAREIGLSEAAKSVKDYYLGDNDLHETIVGKSEYMRQRATHLDRDQADIANKWRGTGQMGFQKYAFFTHAFLDQGASFPLWNNVYLRGLGEHGDEKLAVTQADEAVKKGFMTGGRVDQPAIMRGPEAWKAMTVAYGYSSTLWNAFSRHMAAIDSAWKNGAPLDASYLAARSFVYLFALPALTKAVTSEFLRNSPSNSTNQDREKRIASTILEEATPLKFVPIARDLAPWMINKAMGEPGRDLQFSPLESAAETLLTPLAEAAQTVTGKKTPDKLLEHSVNAISLATGVPKQANDIIFNMIDWTKTNGEVAWRDAVSRKTKK